MIERRWVLVGLALILTACMGASCLDTFQAKDRVTPPFAKWAEFEKSVGEGGAVKAKMTEGEATGAGYEGKSASDFKTEGVQIGGKGAGSGGSTTGFNLLDGMSSSVYVIGAVVVIGAVLIGYFVSWKMGLMVGGAGIVGLASVQFMKEYPWVIGIGAVAVLAVLVYAFYKVRKSETGAVTLEAIVNAVEDLPADVAAAVKSRIKAFAGTNAAVVKSEVNEVKNK